MKKIALLFLFIAIITYTFSQTSQTKYSWANQKLASMSLEEKIAQLLIIRIHSNFDETYNAKMVSDILTYQPGAVCFFQGGPLREIYLTNRIQAVSKIPLLVTMDAEWGPSMRLDSMPRFPRNMTLGALAPQYDSLIYEMGKEIARECIALGIHLNFAPVVDVNNNSKNPVINSRSFGENKEWVVRKGIAYMRGMQSEKVASSAKHFPGHGDTEVDSHKGLPVITKSKSQLFETEIYPFTKMIEQNVPMIMVAHLNIPALDSSENAIATLSYPIVTELLKNQLGYKGIVVSDGMEMDGLRKFYKNGAEAEIKCLVAGIDMLLLPNEMSVIIPEIKKAVESGLISEKVINEKCLKVLQLKEDLGLTDFTPLSTDISALIEAKRANELITTIETKALTLITNDGAVPITNKTYTAAVIFGDQETTPYSIQLCKDLKIKYFVLDKEMTKTQELRAIQELTPYPNVIILYSATNQNPAKQYGISSQSIRFTNELNKTKKVILAIFGNPYALEQWGDVSKCSAVLIGYQRTAVSVSAALDGIFGKIVFEGVLPVTTLKYKSGTNWLHNLNSYTVPSGETQDTKKPVQDQKKEVKSASLSQKTLEEIDSIVMNGINNQYFPGCQVMAIKNGKTVFSRNYGFLDYDKKIAVDPQTMYDIASITKTAATTIAVMKLYDDHKIRLKDKVEQYLPIFEHSPIGKITIDELLTHTSGLPAFIPFYKRLDSDSLRYLYLNDIQNETFTIQIAQNLYLNEAFQTQILQMLKETPLGKKRYEYSDLGFLLLKEIIENITEQTLDLFVSEQFYKPMGMTNTCFNPIQKGIPVNRIAPTENDTYFRMQMIQGFVHDQTAALFGGVCGNAGLFSTAEDMGKLSLMILQKGLFNGKRYVSEATVSLFTTCYPIHNCKSRGLGFYTPNFAEPSEILPKQVSNLTFGHQGFTGTVFWIDPEEQLIYIFLSNRVYPNVEPNNLAKSKIRLILHEKMVEDLKTK